MTEGLSLLKFAAAFVLVLGLMLLAAWALRRFVGRPAAPWARPSSPRLAVMETLALDYRRRLVLVRCDAQAHLVLLGGEGGDTVIATHLPLSAAATGDTHDKT